MLSENVYSLYILLLQLILSPGSVRHAGICAGGTFCTEI